MLPFLSSFSFLSTHRESQLRDMSNLSNAFRACCAARLHLDTFLPMDQPGCNIKRHVQPSYWMPSLICLYVCFCVCVVKHVLHRDLQVILNTMNFQYMVPVTCSLSQKWQRYTHTHYILSVTSLHDY